MNRSCTYKNQEAVAAAFKCPPCSGVVKPIVRNYWLGEARRQRGPHMRLCEAHATWYADQHPSFVTKQAWKEEAENGKGEV